MYVWVFENFPTTRVGVTHHRGEPFRDSSMAHWKKSNPLIFFNSMFMKVLMVVGFIPLITIC